MLSSLQLSTSSCECTRATISNFGLYFNEYPQTVHCYTFMHVFLCSYLPCHPWNNSTSASLLTQQGDTFAGGKRFLLQSQCHSNNLAKKFSTRHICHSPTTLCDLNDFKNLEDNQIGRGVKNCLCVM